MRKRTLVTVGDRVLVGTPGISLPGDWYFATVLWVQGNEFLIEFDHGGQTYREVHDVGYVRAKGDFAALREFQENSRAAVKVLSDRVHQLESELAMARQAVWTELDRLAAEVRP